MSRTWSRILSAEERAEVELLVIQSYIDQETGETRTTRDAKTAFIEAFDSARQAGRSWAAFMADEWVEVGAGTFAANLWKRRDAFTTAVTGEQRVRSLNRGKTRRDADGRTEYVQESLLSWSHEDLAEAIVAEAAREKEARINLETYAALIRLLKQTGAETVEEGLTETGQTLDEYLAAVAA